MNIESARTSQGWDSEPITNEEREKLIDKKMDELLEAEEAKGNNYPNRNDIRKRAIHLVDHGIKSPTTRASIDKNPLDTRVTSAAEPLIHKSVSEEPTRRIIPERLSLFGRIKRYISKKIRSMIPSLKKKPPEPPPAMNATPPTTSVRPTSTAPFHQKTSFISATETPPSPPTTAKSRASTNHAQPIDNKATVKTNPTPEKRERSPSDIANDNFNKGIREIFTNKHESLLEAETLTGMGKALIEDLAEKAENLTQEAGVLAEKAADHLASFFSDEEESKVDLESDPSLEEQLQEAWTEFGKRFDEVTELVSQATEKLLTPKAENIHPSSTEPQDLASRMVNWFKS